MSMLRGLLVLTLAVATAACGNSSREQGAPAGSRAGQGGSGGLVTTGGGDGGGTGGRAGLGGAGSGGSNVAGTAGGGGIAGQAGGPNAMPGQHETCVEFTRTQCNRMYNECAGAPIQDEPCEDTTDTCPDRLFAEGSNVTVPDVVACIARWKATSCDDINAGYFPDCGLPFGDKVLGAACRFSVQCASGRCGDFGMDETHPDCGICIEKPLARGDPCGPNDQCPLDSECSAGICTSTYVSNQPPGALCTRFGQCVHDHLCFDTGDGTEMRCQPVPSEGAPCDRINVCTAGLYCSESGCAPAASAGSPCSVAEPIPSLTSLQYICAVDAVCDKEAPGGPMCVPRGAAGESCKPPAAGYVDPRATCLAGLHCICTDETCATGICSRRRYASESCTETGSRCVAGSACVDGTCVETGLQGLDDKACGS